MAAAAVGHDRRRLCGGRGGQDGRADAEHGRAADGGRRRDVPHQALPRPRHHQAAFPGTTSLSATLPEALADLTNTGLGLKGSPQVGSILLLLLLTTSAWLPGDQHLAKGLVV